MSAVLTTHAVVVIIGGTLIATSIANHLGKVGRTNTLLIERHRLTCWRAMEHC